MTGIWVKVRLDDLIAMATGELTLEDRLKFHTLIDGLDELAEESESEE